MKSFSMKAIVSVSLIIDYDSTLINSLYAALLWKTTMAFDAKIYPEGRLEHANDKKRVNFI